MLLPYPTLIHANDQDCIKAFRAQYPKLDTLSYTIEEKVQGVPVQLCFSAGGGYAFAVRARVLKDGEDMHGLRKLLSAARLQHLFQIWRRWCQTEKKELNVFGVLVNAEGTVPLGVDYGVGAHLLFFDAVKDGQAQSRRAMVTLFENCLDYLVLRYVTTHSLKDALAFEVDSITSKVGGVEFEDNRPAGIVIKPYHNTIVLAQRYFYLKRENDLLVNIEEKMEPVKTVDELLIQEGMGGSDSMDS